MGLTQGPDTNLSTLQVQGSLDQVAREYGEVVRRAQAGRAYGCAGRS